MLIHRPVPRLRDPRLIGALVLLTAFLAIALFVPNPGAIQIRDWARAAGAWFPLVFFIAHALLTIALPRVPFTLGAGLLFGPITGVTIAISATTVSAALAFLLVRAIGRDAIAARLTHPAVAAIDRRLARRGWLAIGSLRLISPIPFPLINYCAGVSSIRLMPFLIATAVGVLPGTIAVVVLGDALTGHIDPALIVVTAVGVAIGSAGLLVDARLGIASARATALVPRTKSRGKNVRGMRIDAREQPRGTAAGWCSLRWLIGLRAATAVRRCRLRPGWRAIEGCPRRCCPVREPR